jgi:hypothetical protein
MKNACLALVLLSMNCGDARNGLPGAGESRVVSVLLATRGTAIEAVVEDRGGDNVTGVQGIVAQPGPVTRWTTSGRNLRILRLQVGADAALGAHKLKVGASEIPITIIGPDEKAARPMPTNTCFGIGRSYGNSGATITRQGEVLTSTAQGGTAWTTTNLSQQPGNEELYGIRTLTGNLSLSVFVRLDGSLWQRSSQDGVVRRIPIDNVVDATGFIEGNVYLLVALKSDGTVWNISANGAVAQVAGLSSIRRLVSSTLSTVLGDNLLSTYALSSDGTIVKLLGNELTKFKQLDSGGAIDFAANNFGGRLAALNIDQTISLLNDPAIDTEFQFKPTMVGQPARVTSLSTMQEARNDGAGDAPFIDPDLVYTTEDGLAWRWQSILVRSGTTKYTELSHTGIALPTGEKAVAVNTGCVLTDKGTAMILGSREQTVANTRLPAQLADFNIFPTATSVTMARGETKQLAFNVVRTGGFAGVLAVSPASVPVGYSIGSATIDAAAGTVSIEVERLATSVDGDQRISFDISAGDDKRMGGRLLLRSL